MRASKALFIVAAVALCAAPARAEGEASSASASSGGMLKLTAGTFQLGGTVGFSAKVDSSNGKTNTGFVFNFSPSGGYFVIDDFELLLGLSLNIPFGDYYSSNGLNFALYPKRFGAEVGARYHFNLAERITAYAGLQIGFGYTWYENAYLRNSGDFTMTLPAGALVALHERVAIDVGLRLILSRNFDYDIWQFTVPVGFLGVQAYF